MTTTHLKASWPIHGCVARAAHWGGAWIGGDNRLGLGVARQESRYGIPGEESYIDMEQTKLSMRSAWALAAGPWKTLTVDGGWADYQHSEMEGGEAASTFKDREWDTRAEAVAGAIGPFSESALGMQLQQRDISALGEGQDYLAPTRTACRAIVRFRGKSRLARSCACSSARVWRMSISMARRFGCADITRLHARQCFRRPGVRTCRELAPGSRAVSAARAPAQTECSHVAPTTVPLTYETGDPSLRQERANSAEVTLRWRGGRVHCGRFPWITDFRQLHLWRIDGPQL